MLFRFVAPVASYFKELVGGKTKIKTHYPLVLGFRN